MMMLRWMCGVTNMARIMSGRIRRTTKAGEISQKVSERRFKWGGYVMRRDEEYVGKTVVGLDVE